MNKSLEVRTRVNLDDLIDVISDMSRNDLNEFVLCLLENIGLHDREFIIERIHDAFDWRGV